MGKLLPMSDHQRALLCNLLESNGVDPKSVTDDVVLVWGHDKGYRARVDMLTGEVFAGALLTKSKLVPLTPGSVALYTEGMKTNDREEDTKMDAQDKQNKFKVGDRVRVVRDTTSRYYARLKSGETGTVEVGDQENLEYTSVRLVGRSQYYIPTHDLELVTPEWSIKDVKVGDKVRVSHQGDVTYISRDARYVQIDGAGYDTDKGHTFELIEAAPVPAPKPSVGDIFDAEKHADLPVGTVLVGKSEESILLTDSGWVDHYGCKFTFSHSLNGATIVYLPESADD